MRKIEQEMIQALREHRFWSKGNTMVHGIDGDVYLHGNHIAKLGKDGVLKVNLYTLREWPSMTTRSRLRALGANLVSIKGILHLDGKSIYSEEWQDASR